MVGILNNISTFLLTLGVPVLVISLIVLGFKVVMAGEGGVRKAIQGSSNIVIGAILIGGASTLGGLIMQTVKGF